MSERDFKEISVKQREESLSLMQQFAELEKKVDTLEKEYEEFCAKGRREDEMMKIEQEELDQISAKRQEQKKRHKIRKSVVRGIAVEFEKRVMKHLFPTLDVRDSDFRMECLGSLVKEHLENVPGHQHATEMARITKSIKELGILDIRSLDAKLDGLYGYYRRLKRKLIDGLKSYDFSNYKDVLKNETGACEVVEQFLTVIHKFAEDDKRSKEN